MQNRCRTKGSPTFVEGVEISSCFDVLWYIWYIIYFHKLRMFEHGTAACPSRPAFPTESSSLGCPAKDSKKGMNCGGCGGTPWNTVKHSAPDPSKSWYASAFWSFWPWAYEKYLWIALWIAMVYSDSEIWKVIWNRFGPYTFGLFCTRVSDVSLHFCWRDELGHHSRPRTHGLPPRFRPWKHDTQTQSQLWQLSEEFRSIAPGERPWWAYTSIGAKLNQCWSNPQPTMLYCGDPRCRMIHRIGASGVKSSAERDHWGSNSSKGNCWAGSPGAVQYLAQHGMIRHVGYVGFFFHGSSFKKIQRTFWGKLSNRKFFNMSSTFFKIFLCQDAGAWGGNTGNAGSDFLGWWIYRNHIESISTSWRHDICHI